MNRGDVKPVEKMESPGGWNSSRSDTELIVSDELAGVHLEILASVARCGDGFCMVYAG